MRIFHLAKSRLLGKRSKKALAASAGFTILELLVACAIFAVMMGLISVAINQMTKGIQTSTSKIDAFQNARTAIETVSRTLPNATLNPYMDYYITSGSSYTNRGPTTTAPNKYGRASDLNFVITNASSGIGSVSDTITHAVFFQAPLGYSTNSAQRLPQGVLNPCGFFVAYGGDIGRTNMMSSFSGIANNNRFRLYQWVGSADQLPVNAANGVIANNWFTSALDLDSASGCRPLADNIIAFVARVPGTNSSGGFTNVPNAYFYNSKTNWPSSSTTQPAQMHQLPPFVEITMVAVEENAMNRLVGSSTTLSEAASALGVGDLDSLFTSASSYSDDLDTITSGLNSKKIPYRIFTTTVPLRGTR